MEKETRQKPLEAGSEIITINAEEIPVEEKIGKTISMELEEANVTEAIITNLQDKYLPLKLRGLDDKEGYLEIVEARKDCKSWRILTGKVCKKGREAAVLEQKLWIAKEKDVSDRIGKVEQYLEAQENSYEAEQNRVKLLKKQAQDKAFALRNTELTAMGAVFNGSEYVSGEISFDLSIVRESDDETYQSLILPKFKTVFDEMETLRIDEEKRKQDEADDLKRQQDTLKEEQQKLLDEQNKLKENQEKIERENREKEENEKREKEKKQRELQMARLKEIMPFGLEETRINIHDLWKLDETQYADLLQEAKTFFENKEAEKKEKQRLSQLGKDRMTLLTAMEPVEIKEDVLSLMDETTWKNYYDDYKEGFDVRQKEKWQKEQDDKKKEADLKKQTELDAANDKTKWADLMQQFEAITVPDFRSSQYRVKGKAIREFLLNLKNSNQ